MRFGFNNEEWDLLTELPLEIYLAMLRVDCAVDSFDEEEIAFGKELEKSAEKCAEGSWMRHVFENADRPTAAQAHGRTNMTEDALCGHLTELRDLLRQRVGEGESTQFAELLVKFARSVAAASGGPFPGAARITQGEGDLIWRMRQALHLVHTIHP